MKVHIFLMMFLFSYEIFADENELIGRWELDENLTKASFDYDNSSDKIKSCFKEGRCSNFALEYGNDTVRIFRYNINYASSFWKYKVIDKTKNVLTIKETYLDGRKYTVKWDIKNDIACMPVVIDTTKYAQCFRKTVP